MFVIDKFGFQCFKKAFRNRIVLTIAFVAHTAAKHAIRGMVKAATVEYSQYKIRFNSVHPGTIRTPLLERLSVANPNVMSVENIPLGRIGESEDIGKLVSFLLSDDSSYITGVAIPIDGGILAH